MVSKVLHSPYTGNGGSSSGGFPTGSPGEITYPDGSSGGPGPNGGDGTNSCVREFVIPCTCVGHTNPDGVCHCEETGNELDHGPIVVVFIDQDCLDQQQSGGGEKCDPEDCKHILSSFGLWPDRPDRDSEDTDPGINILADMEQRLELNNDEIDCLNANMPVKMEMYRLLMGDAAVLKATNPCDGILHHPSPETRPQMIIDQECGSDGNGFQSITELHQLLIDNEMQFRSPQYAGNFDQQLQAVIDTYSPYANEVMPPDQWMVLLNQPDLVTEMAAHLDDPDFDYRTIGNYLSLLSDHDPCGEGLPNYDFSDVVDNPGDLEHIKDFLEEHDEDGDAITAVDIQVLLKDRYPDDYEGDLEDTYRRFKLFSVACLEGDQVCEENMNDETYRTNLVWIQAKVEENPWFLFGECIEDHPKWPQWRNLILFDANSVSQVTDRVQSLGENHFIQSIDDAFAPIMNMDYFSVQATELPMAWGQQNIFTAFEYFRKNLNSDEFVGGQGGCPNTDFRYRDLPFDEQLWQNGDVLGTVFSINLVPGGLDDGAVIASQYDFYPVEEKAAWTFSTMHQDNLFEVTPENHGRFDDGNHPVSGNRQFGLFHTDDGNYEYFTMGADRITTWWQYFMAWSLEAFSDPYGIADPVWDCTQNQIQEYLNSQGIAGFKQQQKQRPKFSEIRNLLKNEPTITFLPCYNE